MNEITPSPTPETPAGVIPQAVSLWGAPHQAYGCPACGQAFLAEPSRADAGLTCPHCGRARLEAQPVRLRPEPPELLAPHQVSRAALQAALARFCQGVWLHSPDFTPETLLARATAVYWPMWLVDAHIEGEWQAEMGFDYQVKSSQEHYAGGGWRSQEVIETRARWEPRAGSISRAYANVAAPALSDQAALERRTGGFNLRAAAAYDPARLAGACVRVPDLDPQAAWGLVEGQLRQAAASDCQRAAAAQHVRSYNASLRYENLNYTQLLLPGFTTWYTDDDGRVQLVTINGQSGQVSGARVASQRAGWRTAGIGAAVAVGLLLLALVCFALAAVVPPLAALGTLLVIAMFGALGFAVVAAAWPAVWNGKERAEG